MRQILLFFTLILLDLKAQDLQPQQNNHFSFYKDPWVQYLNTQGKKIKQINFYSSKNPKDDDYQILDSNGLILERKCIDRWSIGPFQFKNFFFRKYEYKNNDLIKAEYLDKKGNTEHLYLYEYAFQNKVKHSQSFRKQKKLRESFTDYNTDSTQKEYRNYKIKGQKQKLALRYEYDYYPDKQKKETRQYNRKNKLKHTWKYDCSPKGEIVKQETQVCKNTGTNNKGQTVDVIFYTDAKGKRTKHIQIYYMKDGKKKYVSFENYIVKKGKEIKNSDTHFADSLEPYYHHRYYNKNGNIVSEWKDEYSSYVTGRTTLRSSSFILYHKGKATMRQKATYNEKGLPMVNEVFDEKNKLYGKAVFKYEGDNSYVVDHYNKKQKLIEVYNGEVTYY